MKLTIIGQKELSAKFNTVIHRIGSLEVEFGLAGKILKDFYSTAPFLSSGGVYGERWAPLNPKYKKEKERKYPGRPILVASGKMMDSFIAEITPMSLTISNTTDYFAKHQLGEGVPQRVMMALDRQRVDLVVKTVSDSLKKRINEAWI